MFRHDTPLETSHFLIAPWVASDVSYTAEGSVIVPLKIRVELEERVSVFGDTWGACLSRGLPGRGGWERRPLGHTQSPSPLWCSRVKLGEVACSLQHCQAKVFSELDEVDNLDEREEML